MTMNFNIFSMCQDAVEFGLLIVSQKSKQFKKLSPAFM